MKKIKWLISRLLILTLFLLGIIVINTITFTSKQLIVNQNKVNPINIPDSLVDALSKVVQIKTASYNNYQDSIGLLALKHFFENRFPWIDSLVDRTIINQFSQVYKWAGRRPKLPPILLTAHLDVVPPEKGSLDEWTHPPFSGKIDENGYVWGRGTLDDKVSALAILETVNMLLKEGYQPERTLYLAFGHDEEIGGKNGARQIANYFKEENIQFEFVLDEGLVVLENALPGLNPPLCLIGIGEKGYFSVELTAEATQGGHSSMPPKETAVGMLSEAIFKLQSNPFPSRVDGALGNMFDFTGPEMTWPNKAIFANRWLFGGLIKSTLEKKGPSNAAIRTTIAPTMLEAGIKDNMLPSSAKATLNLRLLPGDNSLKALNYLEKVIDNPQISITPKTSNFSSEPSTLSSHNSFGFKVIQRSAKEVFPEVVAAPSLVLGATDGRHYSEVAQDIYRFLPAVLKQSDLKRIHGVDERIHSEAYKKMISFYRQLILNSTK